MNDPLRKLRSVPGFRWFKSTSNRTFIVWPIVLFAVEAAIQRGMPRLNLWALPLLPWGYLQYYWVGAYRTKLGGGGPGLSNPPERIVDAGIYRWTRNPMYLGHIIFFIGIALVLESWIAAAVLAFHLVWFDLRARGDEQHLGELFGDPYREYSKRVARWIPATWAVYLTAVLVLIGAATLPSWHSISGHVTDATGKPVPNVFVVSLFVQHPINFVHPETTCARGELTRSGNDGSFHVPVGFEPSPDVFLYAKGLDRDPSSEGYTQVKLVPTLDSPARRFHYLTTLGSVLNCGPFTVEHLEPLRPLMAALDDEARGLGPLDPMEYHPDMFVGGLDRVIRDAKKKQR